MIDNTLCEFLEWDTVFFEKRIARVKVSRLNLELAQAIDDWCHKEAIEGLYFLADSDDKETVAVAENFSYQFTDIRMVFQRDLSQIDLPQPNPDYVLRMAQKADLEELLRITENTFTHSRFYYDSHFSQEQCDRLYQTWIRRSVTENFADTVFVIAKDAAPLAYIACVLDKQNHIGSIGLLGVSEAARGQNLGSELIKSALSYFREAGMKRAEVVTQGRNVLAQRFYQKAGFRSSKVQLWYHKWFKDETKF